ncbi:unnamed protein product [Rotaria magnacalcarata]|uniref:Uncharacterized protein n=1 Tax=Rotaria magnacalcarata TaxID=392030 RepID=A0A816SX70_9BILA|nr:unnamed protein product [Rotaria magnacalcarata]
MCQKGKAEFIFFKFNEQGRKKPSTEDDDRQLLYIMKKDRTKSSQMLAAEWILSNDKKLCGSTVRRRLIKNNEPFNFVPRVQGGGGTVSVWGCMPGDACGSLIIYTGKMNGPAYIKTIQDALPIFIENKFDTVNDN